MVTRQVLCVFLVESDSAMGALARVPGDAISLVEQADEIGPQGMFLISQEGLVGQPAPYDERDHAEAQDLLVNLDTL